MRALFAGSFDPPTFGHLDLIERSAKLVDHLIVAVASNVNKEKALLSTEERVTFLSTYFKETTIEVVAIEGLIFEYARVNKISFLVRGVRSLCEMEKERSLALINRELGGIETLFLLADPSLSHLSSTTIRELAHFGHSLKGLVPDPLEALITSKVLRK